MKTVSVSAIAVALALGLVTAAEAEDWTGSFVTIGLSSSATDLNLANGGHAAADDDTAAYLALGHDWQVGDLTYGILADIDGLDAKQDYVIAGKNHVAEADMFATLRGRVGAEVSDRMRVTASAGLAWMNTTVTNTVSNRGDSDLLFGGVVGAGIDYALTPGYRLSLEYVHADFRDDTALSGAVDLEPKVDALRLGLTMRF